MKDGSTRNGALRSLDNTRRWHQVGTNVQLRHGHNVSMGSTYYLVPGSVSDTFTRGTQPNLKGYAVISRSSENVFQKYIAL